MQSGCSPNTAVLLTDLTFQLTLFWWFGRILWPQGSGQSVWYSASWPVGRIRVCSDDGKNRVSWERGEMGLCWWTPSGCSPQVLYNVRTPHLTAAWATLTPGDPWDRVRCVPNTALPYGHVCLQTVEGLSHHVWGQLFCQLLWLVSAWEFWRTLKKAMWPGMLWGWGWRKRESALLTQWGVRSCSSALSADGTARRLCHCHDCLQRAAARRQHHTGFATVLKLHLQKCQLHGSQDRAVF